MPKIEVYKCGECGKIRGESNHWWWAGRYDATVEFAVRPMDSAPHPDNSECYCGQECVSKALARYMASVGQPKEAA